MSEEELLALVGLAALPSLTPSRLRTILARHEPADAFARVRAGRPLDRRCLDRAGDLERKLHLQAATADPARVLDDCEQLGIRVVTHGSDGFPDLLVDDPGAPVVVYARGELDAFDRRRVGVVGTRNATAAGRATATELGHELAADGCSVVSGLARGIDAAAHRGVRAAAGPGRAVAVVGCGLDRPYPRQNAELWEWIGTSGLLLSEWPPGTEPDGWRFPRRNRVIAALSEVLVVVESRESGGSLITAGMAGELGATVMAVPGSPRSRASIGTNRLLVDGAAPVTCTDDVRVALGLENGQARLDWSDRPSPPDVVASSVLEMCRPAPVTLDDVVRELGLSIPTAALALARLERDGWLVDNGGWFEFAGSKLRLV